MSKRSAMKVRKQVTTVKGNSYEYWIVDIGKVDGKRRWVRRDEAGNSFTSKQQADRWAKRELERRDLRSRKAGEDAKKLTPDALRDAVDALTILDGRGTLKESASYFVESLDVSRPDKTIAQVIEEYAADREHEGRREQTIKDIRRRLGAFARDYGETLIADFEKADRWKLLREWVRGKQGSQTNRRNYRVHLSGLFEFARREGYVLSNPVKRFRVSSSKRERVEILTVAQARKLLATTQKADAEMIPFISLCMFAGLRPDGECKRIKWEDIDFDLCQIYVGDDVAKKQGQDRYVNLPDNLIEWLLPYRKKRGPIHFRDSSYRKIRKESGIKWAIDIMRHSFGSYLYAQNSNAGEVAEQMGHRGTMMLFKHYRAAISKKAKSTKPEAYWDIRPSDGKKVVAFTKMG